MEKVGDAFRSKHLIYRGVEYPNPSNSNDLKDIQFIHKVAKSDSVSMSQIQMGPVRPSSLDDAEKLCKFISETLMGCVVCLKPEFDDSPPEDGKPRPIGTVHLVARGVNVAHHRRSDIGIMLLDGFRGKGYGGEAINWVLDWGFRFGGLHSIGIGCFSFNTGAHRLYKRLGFVEEGREREAMWFDGAFHDMISLGMLDREWKALRASTEEAQP